ncbi:hypothetical protein GCM10017559_02550 [Streptosporangium longisporum]|uniref:Uncharacterized protein n=1 Tax=Streptosporangium longisporum TaxID=46187 RepID=A0ABN3XPV4_9ACTN
MHAAFYLLNGDRRLHLAQNTWDEAGLNAPRKVIGDSGPQDVELVQFALNELSHPLRFQYSEDINKFHRFLGAFEVNATYRSCVVATVGLGDGASALRQGLLVLVSHEVGAFGRSDAEALRLLAGLLAAALAHGNDV